MCFATAEAQTLDDIGRICIMISTVKDDAIPPDAAKVLESRMHGFILSQGIADNGLDRRFEMIAKVATISKDIVGGTPGRISQKLEISFYINDVIENKEFGRVSLNAIGVGLNETKSYIMAFNSIKADNTQVGEMLESAKNLIVKYYQSNAERILNEAKILADRGQYDEAIFILSTIPDVCGEEYSKSQTAVCSLYLKKINYEGAELLMKAKAAWAESPDSEGAARAIEYLDGIDVLASCNADVSILLNEITEKIKDDKKKEWEFMLKQYEDEKIREQREYEFRVRKYEDSQKREEQLREEEKAREQRDYEFAVRKHEDETAFQRAVLDASREVALAYAKKK